MKIAANMRVGLSPERNMRNLQGAGPREMLRNIQTVI